MTVNIGLKLSIIVVLDALVVHSQTLRPFDQRRRAAGEWAIFRNK